MKLQDKLKELEILLLNEQNALEEYYKSDEYKHHKDESAKLKVLKTEKNSIEATFKKIMGFVPTQEWSIKKLNSINNEIEWENKIVGINKTDISSKTRSYYFHLIFPILFGIFLTFLMLVFLGEPTGGKASSTEVLLGVSTFFTIFFYIGFISTILRKRRELKELKLGDSQRKSKLADLNKELSSFPSFQKYDLLCQQITSAEAGESNKEKSYNENIKLLKSEIENTVNSFELIDIISQFPAKSYGSLAIKNNLKSIENEIDNQYLQNITKLIMHLQNIEVDYNSTYESLKNDILTVTVPILRRTMKGKMRIWKDREYIEDTNNQLRTLYHATMEMIECWKKGDKSGFFLLYNNFENIGVFDSSWMKNMIGEMQDINNNLNRLTEILQMSMRNLNSSLTEIKVSLEDSNQALWDISFSTGNTDYSSSAIQSNLTDIKMMLSKSFEK